METEDRTAAELGPVELIVLTFPGERADPAVIEAITDIVSKGYVTVLDFVFLTRTTDSRIRITDVDEDLDTTGFASLQVSARALISEHDVDIVRDLLEPGTSAAVIVYEESWARRVAGAVRSAGGEVMLHLPVPPETVDTAVAAAGAPR